MQDISKPRPPNVVIVALANKLARTIWALMAERSGSVLGAFWDTHNLYPLDDGFRRQLDVESD